jgi:hypothetical protein
MMRCCICGICTQDVEEALDNGWVPYFLEGTEEHGPCCLDCFEVLLYLDKDGEPRIKEKFRGKIVYIEEYCLNEKFEQESPIVFN